MAGVDGSGEIEPGRHRANFFETWLRGRGLSRCGTARTALFLAREPERDDLVVSLLAAECDSPTEIRGRALRRAAARDLAQYGSARMRAALEAQRTSGVEDGLRVIEELGTEFSAAMTFWDTRNFRYRTAQALSDEVSSAFGVPRLMSTYMVNKGALEQLVSTHSARQAEVESRSIDRLLLLLAMIQAVPTLYSVWRGLLSGRLAGIEVAAGLASAAVCLVLWLVFRWKRSRDRRTAALEKLRGTA